jgi:glycosyltransferase involved in cell wall biosynthesis
MPIDISIVLITARDDFPMLGLPTTHLLGPCISSLKAQEFKNFELIVVDGLYEFRPEMFRGNPFDAEKLPFKVKHTPVHPKHAFWFSRHRPYSCEAFNTGLIYATGELVVKLDDCCEFDEKYLKTIWELYQCGYFPLSMHVKYIDGKPAYFTKEHMERAKQAGTSEGKWKEAWVGTAADEAEHERIVLGIYERLFGDGGPIRDTRWKEVEKSGGQMIAERNWFYGYSSFPLESGLKVNGMDELMDNDFSLMDVDFGQRLLMAEHDNIFLLDARLRVVEHSHVPISLKLFDAQNIGTVKCNYAILKINERKKRLKANSDFLNNEDLEFVKKETLRHPCSWNPHQYMDDCEGPMFKLWAANQPIFDLREERKNVQE